MERAGKEDPKELVRESQENPRASGRVAEEPASDQEKDPYGHTRESVDKMLVRAIKRRFSDVLESAFFFSTAEVKAIKINKDDLQLIVIVPFVLPQPSEDGGLWWDTAAAQKQLKRDFANHLGSSKFKKTIGNFFYTELSHFLLERGNIRKYPKEIQKSLRKLPQQALAGRTKHPIGKSIATIIRTDGVRIYQTLQNMQTAIKRWRVNDPKIENPGIKKKLSRSYPLKTYPWMAIFHDLVPKLPCKPYLDCNIQATDVLDENGHLLPAKLSEPDRWSTINIATKIIQSKLLVEQRSKFPLRGIRQVLAKARPQFAN